MRILYFLIASVIFLSCKKEKAEAISFSEATYKITITGTWQSPALTVPAGAHFTTFAGMIHNQNIFLWQEGKLASIGVEVVAENGNAGPLLKEIDTAIANKKAIASILITQPPPTGTVTSNFYCNSNYSYISFESMIAPSPDWFIGLSSFNLYQNNQWVTDTILPLFVYDAGTEDGDVFGYNNPPTSPQQNIQKLQAANGTVLANGNAQLAAIATIRFTKL